MEIGPGDSEFPAAPVRTTLLASCWGVLAVYALIHALLIQHSLILAFAYFFPLLAVWAALERKRWGRLSLLGMCLLMPVILLVVLLYLDNAHLRLNLDALIHFGMLQSCGGMLPGISLIMLSMAGTYWFSHPQAVAEFERNKRPALARAQHSIALTLASIWALMVLGCAVAAGQHAARRSDEYSFARVSTVLKR